MSVGSDPSSAAYAASTAAAPDAASDQPLVSVVLPCYREPIEILRRSIDSILGQSYPNFELIVVLDDPADAAKAEFLTALAATDDRIRVIVNSENLGPWGSYNRGVREARGALIAIQDSDDVSVSERLEHLTRYLLEHPGVGVVGSALEYVDEASGRTIMMRTYPADAARAIRRYSPLAHPTTVRRAALFATNGGYDVSRRYRHAADYELWCRWYTAGVAMANDPGVYYRYFQGDSNFKTQNVTAILRDTVRIKARYARRLRFGVGDYLWLAAEAVACALPSCAVVAAFYRVNRRRSAEIASPTGAKVETTKGIEYTRHLTTRPRWKSLFNVQAPYRWNVRLLRLGYVLDVGCGVGRNLAHLNGNGVGVDHNAHSVAEARARGLEAYTVEEFRTVMAGREPAFDSLLCSHVLEHMGVEEGRSLLREYLPQVKSQGKVVLIVPGLAGFRSEASHVEYFDSVGLAALTAPLPLRLERVFSFPFPGWMGRFFRYNETVAVYRRLPEHAVDRSPDGRPSDRRPSDATGAGMAFPEFDSQTPGRQRAVER